MTSTTSDRVDANGAPIIPGFTGKLLTLMRRREHLDEQLSRPITETDPERRRKAEGRRGFIVRERDALSEAIRAMQYHRAVLSGLDEPLAVLRAVAEGDEGPLIQRRAQAVLAEFGL